MDTFQKNAVQEAAVNVDQITIHRFVIYQDILPFNNNKMKTWSTKKRTMRAISTTSKPLTLHSAVLATVKSVEFLILLDSGLSSWCICINLISALNLKSTKTEKNCAGVWNNNKRCTDIFYSNNITNIWWFQYLPSKYQHQRI